MASSLLSISVCRILQKKMEELEYVQKKLLKTFIEETEKEKQDKSLINHLAKTICENSKVLADFGMAPPIMSKILDVVSTNYSGKRNQEDEEFTNKTFTPKY